MILRRLFPKSYPAFDWIQVEVTSYCNAACVYCPHTEYKRNWQNRHLPQAVFQKLVPAFETARLVYLQGWGEPFLHPHFFDMLRCAKKAGCLVGTTTNATVLDRKIVQQLIREGLDVIGFSLAGLDEKNDAIRKGTSLKQTLDCIETFQQAKRELGSDHPHIHIAYMLLRSGLDDLEKIPEFLAGRGVAQAVISSLSLAVNPEMEAESILAADENEYHELQHRFDEIKKQSAKRDVELHFHLVSHPMLNFKCSENIQRAVVVGSDGRISPCVFTQIPVNGEQFYYFRGRKISRRSLSFGNLHSELLETVWHGKDYQQFLDTHRRGRKPDVCEKCLKGYVINC